LLAKKNISFGKKRKKECLTKINYHRAHEENCENDPSKAFLLSLSNERILQMVIPESKMKTKESK
jgi:hypothetical protein